MYQPCFFIIYGTEHSLYFSILFGTLRDVNISLLLHSESSVCNGNKIMTTQSITLRIHQSTTNAVWSQIWKPSHLLDRMKEEIYTGEGTKLDHQGQRTSQ